jgi:hypothetical protein
MLASFLCYDGIQTTTILKQIPNFGAHSIKVWLRRQAIREAAADLSPVRSSPITTTAFLEHFASLVV